LTVRADQGNSNLANGIVHAKWNAKTTETAEHCFPVRCQSNGSITVISTIMSEITGSQGMRRRYVLISFLLILTFIYAILFAFVFRKYAYAEPGGFPVFYTSGKLARFDVQALYSRHFQDVFHPANDGVGYFFHLPYELVLLIPLSYLPQVPAYGVWVTLNLACLLGVAVILRRHFPNFELLVPFAFAPTLSLLLNGQDIGILSLLAVLAFDRFATCRDIEAGLLMACGLFKFPLVVPLAAMLGFKYWKVLVGFVVGSIPLLGFSAIAVGRQGIYDYLALTRGTDAKEDPAILVNLRGVIGTILGPHTTMVIVISILCLVVVASMRAARIPTFCLAIVATVLVSWHAHLYDALLLLIPMAWMYESNSGWMRQSPNVLILLSMAILPNSRYGYLVGIFLCLVFPLLLILVTLNQAKQKPNPVTR
jgi:hypothetical protein